MPNRNRKMVNGGRVRAVGCETIDLKRSKKRN